ADLQCSVRIGRRPAQGWRMGRGPARRTGAPLDDCAGRSGPPERPALAATGVPPAGLPPRPAHHHGRGCARCPRDVRTSPYSPCSPPPPGGQASRATCAADPGPRSHRLQPRREGRRGDGAPMGTISPDGRHGVDPSRITTRDEFRDALTTLRESAGLTVREAARAARLPGSTAGGYFSGRHLPPLSPPHILADLLAACGVTGEETVAQWRRALARVRRTPGPRRADAPVPYRGLASFQPEDAEWFHGRESLTALVLARLAEQAAAGGGIVAVVGASGSGKSSLLRAGVIPALRDGAVPGVASRPVHLMTPGHEPLAQLQALLDGDSGQPGHPGGLVVVVDQLEELFAPSVSHEEREAFVARLATLAAPLSGGTAGTVGAASGTAGRAGGA